MTPDAIKQVLAAVQSGRSIDEAAGEIGAQFEALRGTVAFVTSPSATDTDCIVLDSDERIREKLAECESEIARLRGMVAERDAQLTALREGWAAIELERDAAKEERLDALAQRDTAFDALAATEQATTGLTRDLAASESAREQLAAQVQTLLAERYESEVPSDVPPNVRGYILDDGAHVVDNGGQWRVLTSGNARMIDNVRMWATAVKAARAWRGQ